MYTNTQLFSKPGQVCRRDVRAERNSATPHSYQLIFGKVKTFTALFMATLFTLALPGISVGQCPTSFSGKMDNDIGTSTCGFKSIEVRLLSSDNFSTHFGAVSVVFSNNVQIESVVPSGSGISVSNGLTQFDFDITLASGVSIVAPHKVLATFYYTLISGTTGTAATTSTGVAAINGGSWINCGLGSNEAAYNLGMQSRTLTGYVLIPSEFNCSQGTNHGLPDRDISIEMNDSPNWEICAINNTPNDGEYECIDLRSNCEYKVCIFKPDDEICGINEYDVALITSHIIEEDCFDYVWQMLAADVNNNGQISGADVTQLNKVLLSITPDNFPLPWKYVSYSELNGSYLETKFDECSVNVVVIDNCDEIIMDANPKVEDWYGFPVGDVDYSCTDCAFSSGPIARTNQLSFDPVRINSSNLSEHKTIFQFISPSPVRVWSLSLQLDSKIEDLNDLTLNKSKEDLFDWTYDKNSKILKMVFATLNRDPKSEFNLELSYSGIKTANFPVFKINTDDPRINNVLIDQNKVQRKFELESTIQLTDPFADYLAEQKVIRLNYAIDLHHRVSIFDLQGKRVFTSFSSDLFVPVGHLPDGVYILQIESELELKTMKLLIY